jgi:hypothetical protein
MDVTGHIEDLTPDIRYCSLFDQTRFALLYKMPLWQVFQMPSRWNWSIANGFA